LSSPAGVQYPEAYRLGTDVSARLDRPVNPDDDSRMLGVSQTQLDDGFVLNETAADQAALAGGSASTE